MENWCTQKWKNDKSKLFRKTKKHKIARSRYNEKEHISIFFGLCLAAILVFACISVASATNYMPQGCYSFTIETSLFSPVSDPSGPYTGTEGVPIDYDGSGSYDTDGSIVAYEWDFGDGNTATGVAPTHTYAQDGIYTVTLTVTDNDGATNTSTTTATIADTGPTAAFSATPTSGQAPLTVTFYDNSTSYDGIEAREWVLDNDGAIDSTVQNPTYVFAEEGVYTVSLKVTESDGDSDTMTKTDYITVTAVNQIEYIWLEAEDADTKTPDFETVSDISASNGEYIQIPEGVGFRAHDGEATYRITIASPGNYIVWGSKIAATGGDNSFFVQIDDGTRYLWTISLSDNWQWDAVNHWGSGGEFDPEIDPVAFTLSAGEHTLRIIQREDGAKLDELLITNDMLYVPVSNQPPTAIIDSITPEPSEQVKDTVSFSGHGTDTDGTVAAYNWHSSMDGQLSTASSFSKPASELSVGMHTIYFKVQDDEGAWSMEVTEDLTIIEPANQAPVADPSGPYTGTEGVPIGYDGSGSYDTDGSIVAYEWDFGDGTTATGVAPTHTYAQDGIYTVTLTVTDNDGATDTSITAVTIADTGPTAAFSATPTSGQEPLTVAFTDSSTSYDGIEAREWDLDNDGVIDSTVQNPTYVFAEEGVYTVSLKVTESDGDSDTMTKASYITVTMVNNDLVAEWHLDEGSGEIAGDTSGNGNDGALVNNPAWVNGKVGKGLSFDGTNDYINCGHGSSLKITGAITVEAWVKWRGTGNPYFVTKTGGPGRRSFDLSGNEDGTVEFRVGGADCNSLKSSGTISIPNGEWVHLVGTYEPSSYVRLFVDGALAKENTVSIPASQGDNGLPWYIGAREGNQGWFNGIIDEVKIYNGALSAEEIRANYEAYPSNLLPTAFIDSITPDPAEQGKDIVSFSGHGTDTDGSVVAYNWSSSFEGLLSTASSFSKPASELSEGTHAIYFKVQDDDGEWSTAVTEDLTIIEPANQPPVSDQNEPYTGTERDPITFNGSGSYDPDGSIVAYEWDFGDGNSASGVTPTHTYAQNGTYTVTLTVTDNEGATDTSATTATIADTGPTADFSATPTSGQEPLTVTFTDNSTSHDGIIAWNWDFNNDGVTDSTAQNPTHVYAEEGVYTVSLTIHESYGDSDAMTKASYITVTTVNNDLVAEWHLDEGSGEIAGDTSGNGNEGALVNNPAWVNGKVGKGLSFDGTNDYINCGHGSSLKITGAITVEAWVKWLGTGNPYFVTKTGGPGRRSFDLSGNEDGTVEFRVGGADCNSLKSSGTISIPNGEWVHLVGTYEPSSYVRLFVDGALAKENTVSIPASQGDNGLPWYIGAREGNQGWFNGIIDEVKIYNGALSAEEIRANYEAYPSNLLPTAFIDSITPDPAEQGKHNVSFSGHGTDTDGTVAAYNWHSSMDGQLSTASSFSKPASELSVGSHTIYFKVQDDEGAWSMEVTEDLTIIEPANQAPVADPSGPYTGTEGVPIAYDGSDSYDTDGRIVAYEWDFGDGNTATGVAPTHTYAKNGTYTVGLTVTDNDGATDTSATTATIPDIGPTAAFSATPTSGQEPLTVAFTDASTSHDGIEAWNWDFDSDGETDSTEQNPTHVYAEDGIYTVNLIVTESDGDSDTMTKANYITVTKANQLPITDPNGPYTGTEGVPIAYDGSTSLDPDGTIVAYEWDFGDGSTATGVAPTHTYAQNGTYTVTLTVTDNEGATNTSTTTATIADIEPTADSSASPTSGQAPLTVIFTDNSISYDGIEAWNWDFDNDGVTDSTVQNPTYEYAEEGVYSVSLTITESDGDSGSMTKTDYITVTKANEPPVSDPSGPYTGTEGVPIAYDGSGSYDPDGTIVAYEWDFGDGTTATGVAPTYTYAQDGTYTVTLTVTDNEGATNTSATTATIADTGPTAAFSATPTSGQEPLTVAFTDASASHDGLEAWNWDFDSDGETDSTEQNPTHVFAEDGIYTVSLTVTESDGDSDTMTKADYITVTKANQLPITDPNGPYTGTEGVAIAFDGSTSLDPDGSIVAYEWDFGDGKTETGVAPTHTHAQDGFFTVTLTVTDNDGATNTSTTAATIADTEPVADFSAMPTSGLSPLTVAFTDASTSHDGIEAWSWDFDSDGETDSTEQNPTHVYAEEGVYTVSLKVYENDGDNDSMTKANCITVIRVNQPPVSEPNGPYTGTEGVAIAFDGSTSLDPDGSIVAYEWDFGDGTTATGVAPTHTYAQDGTYTVTLTVTDNEGATNTSTTTATIADIEPTADFSASPTSGQAPLTVIFTDNSILYDGIEAWNWDFDNDGVTDSTVQNPTYEYAEEGVYSVSLTITESDGDSGSMTKTDYITVTKANEPPVSDPSGPYTGTEGVPIAYDGSGSYDPDGTIVAYEWDFGDGTTATGVAPTHTYAQDGIYTVTLTVTDNEGATNTSTTTATIADTEPTAAFSATPTSGPEPLTVTFSDNSASYDGIVTWDWDFDNDGETDSTEQNPTHVYAEEGVYTVSLTITESDDDSDTMTKVDYITVTRVNAPPEADPSGPYTGTEGAEVVYDGSNSYDTDGSIVAYEWDFGDGDTATGVAPTHTYAQEGTYTVALTVTDNDDATNTSTTTATIADTEPTAAFSAARTYGRKPLTVAFTDKSASYDGLEEWAWDFDNDGVADSTEQNPTHVYIRHGRYTVSLTVTESDGDSGTMTKADYITVIKWKDSNTRRSAPVSPSGGATDVPVDED